MKFYELLENTHDDDEDAFIKSQHDESGEERRAERVKTALSHLKSSTRLKLVPHHPHITKTSRKLKKNEQAVTIDGKQHVINASVDTETAEKIKKLAARAEKFDVMHAQHHNTPALVFAKQSQFSQQELDDCALNYLKNTPRKRGGWAKRATSGDLLAVTTYITHERPTKVGAFAWPAVEPYLSKFVNLGVVYCVQTQQRMPAVEQQLLTQFAADGRNEEAPHLFVWYASKVIKGRWLAAENLLFRPSTKSLYNVVEYARSVVGGKLPEIDQLMLQKATGDEDGFQNASTYACVRKQPWPEYEALLTRLNGSKRYADYILPKFVEYAIVARGRSWPQLESVINGLTNSNQWQFTLTKQFAEYVKRYGGKFSSGVLDAIDNATQTNLKQRLFIGAYLHVRMRNAEAHYRTVLRNNAPGQKAYEKDAADLYADRLLGGKW